MAKSALYSTALAILLFCFCDAHIPRLIRGRSKGGFLGNPGNKHRGQNATPPPIPPEQWYNQKLDHFSGADQRYWQQRFFVNDTFYKPGGPLFVQIGGEGAVSATEVLKGAWIGYAQTNNAYCALLEHRFYGKSHPTEDMSDDNLQYLSSEQALADLAAFISDMKAKLGNPKVITFGCSYPGSLSAWFRLKYPHLVDGAIASSAPLLAKVNFFEYLEVVNDALLTFDPDGSCNMAVREANTLIQKQLMTEEGRTKLKQQFNLCETIDLKNAKDIATLFATLADNFEIVVQYNTANRAFEGGKGGHINLDTLCNIMVNTSAGDVVQRYADVNSLFPFQGCLDFKYEKIIDTMKAVSWNSSATGIGCRQWMYQACTEFAFFQSSDSTKQPFGHGFPIHYWTTQCADIYGPAYNLSMITNAVKRSNTDYGALGIKVTRVVFPNGSMDPWHVLGVTKDLGPDTKAIFINGTSHCADVHIPSPDDPPQLVQARAEIAAIIQSWLKS